MRQVPPHVIAWKNKISLALEARGHETAARTACLHELRRA